MSSTSRRLVSIHATRIASSSIQNKRLADWCVHRQDYERANSRTSPQTESQSADDSRGAPIQLEKSDSADSARLASGGDGRLWFGQVFADLRHSRRCSTSTPERCNGLFDTLRAR